LNSNQILVNSAFTQNAPEPFANLSVTLLVSLCPTKKETSLVLDVPLLSQHWNLAHLDSYLNSSFSSGKLLLYFY